MSKTIALINDELCLSVEVVAKAIGVSIERGLNTVWKGLKDHRNGVGSWRHYADENDNRRKWIAYESIPESTRFRVDHFFENDIWSHYLRQKFFDKIDQYKDTSDVVFFLSFDKIDSQKAAELSRAAAWLRMLHDRALRDEYSTDTSYFEMAAKCISEESLYGLKCKNGRVLKRRVKKWSTSKLDSLISGYWKNSNSSKLTDSGLKFILHSYAQPIKPTIRKVHQLYNAEVVRQPDWCAMSEERIRQILMHPDHQQLIAPARHGVSVMRNRMERTIKRRKPSFADALWSLDGFTIQLRYRDENGKVKSGLYCVAVMDVFSDCIIGFSIGSTETQQLVQGALRAATMKSLKLPHQLQYDNSSANKSQEAQQLMKRLSSISYPCAPYNGKAKPIESLIGRIERLNLRYFPNFKGGNITSPSLEIKANADYLNNQELPTKKQAIAQFELAIETHNHSENKNGSTPIQLYNTPSDHRRDIDFLMMVEAFWVERRRPIRYGKDGLIMEVNRDRYTYEVESEKGIEDMAFRREYLGSTFTVKYDPENLDQIALYLDGSYITTACQKHEYPMAEVDFQDGEKQMLHKALGQRKSYIEDSFRELDQMRAELIEEGLPVDLDHALLNKDAYNRMEQGYLDELIDRSTQRKEKVSAMRSLYDDDEADGSILKD